MTTMLSADALERKLFFIFSETNDNGFVSEVEGRGERMSSFTPFVVKL